MFFYKNSFTGRLVTSEIKLPDHPSLRPADKEGNLVAEENHTDYSPEDLVEVPKTEGTKTEGTKTEGTKTEGTQVEAPKTPVAGEGKQDDGKKADAPAAPAAPAGKPEAPKA